MAKNSTAAPLGTDNLKRVLAFILLTVNMLVELLRNFNYGKALGLALHIGENLSILDVAKVALLEFRDLSVEESRDVAAFLGQEFDIADDALEARIEGAINFLPRGYELLKANISYGTEVYEFIKDWKQPAPDALPRLEASLRSLNLEGLKADLKRA